MGLVLTEAEVADWITVLFDSELTYVVRPSADNSNRYYMIGESYLHGFRDVEACESTRTNEVLACTLSCYRELSYNIIPSPRAIPWGSFLLALFLFRRGYTCIAYLMCHLRPPGP